MPLLTPKRAIKAVFVISAIGFIMVDVSILLREDDVSASTSVDMVDARNQLKLDSVIHNFTGSAGDIFLHRERSRLRYQQANLSRRNHTNASHPIVQLPRVSHMSGNLSEIRAAMLEANRRQNIANLDIFDLVASDSAVVVVIQVHNRTEYLRHLVSSLRKAVDIEQTLLIFSHDFYSDELNDIVASIDFCPVMQIFYPYSMQLYSNVFPGEDPRDCPRNVNKDQAMKIGCQNKDYPDKYGHYREAKYCQTKNHWFWKINHAFDHLAVTRNFNGPLLFIEEDHYLVEDFIPVLRMMYRLKARACRDCNILTLGTYDKKPSYSPNSPKVDIMTWVSSKHNMGMSLTRDTWNMIKNCSTAFCRFDDYNWDWSLNYIGVSCTETKFRVMIMKAPRVFHIGECGLHAKGKNCNPSDRVKVIEKLLSDNADSLFPDSLVINGYPNVPRRVHKPNGGWGDIRDHELCIVFTHPQSHS